MAGLIPAAAALLLTVLTVALYATMFQQVSSRLLGGSTGPSAQRLRTRYALFRGLAEAALIWSAVSFCFLLVWLDMDRIAPGLVFLGPPIVGLIVEVISWPLALTRVVEKFDRPELLQQAKRLGLRVSIAPALIFCLLYGGAYLVGFFTLLRLVGGKT